MKFTNLLGLECFTDSNKIIEYPLNIANLFVDPISLEYFKAPIILKDHHFNIYDHDTIIEWLSRSNKEPITGSELKTVQIIYFKNMIYAMMLLEIKDDKLIFHQPNIDLLNFMNIMTNAFYNKYEKNVHYNNRINDRNKFELNLPKDSVMYLDLKMYLTKYNDKMTDQDKYFYTDLSNLNESIIQHSADATYNCIGFDNNINPFIEYYYFSLEDLLINDLFTGKKIIDPILTMDGTLLDKNTLTLIPNRRHFFGVDELTYKSRNKLCECKIIFEKMLLLFDSKDDKPKDFKSIIKEKLCPVVGIFHIESSLNFINGDYYLEAIETYEHIYRCYCKLMNDINNGLYHNFEKNKKIISDYTKHNNVKFDYSAEMESNNDEINKIIYIRKKLQFPIILSDSYYGDDLSLLDLSNSSFDKRCDGKDVEYVGTNLNCTTFSNCNFRRCSFIATELTNTVFENCEFKESLFYKVELKNTQFIDCKFERTKFLGTMNSTKFIRCNYDNFTIDKLNNYNVKGFNDEYELN